MKLGKVRKTKLFNGSYMTPSLGLEGKGNGEARRAGAMQQRSRRRFSAPNPQHLGCRSTIIIFTFGDVRQFTCTQQHFASKQFIRSVLDKEPSRYINLSLLPSSSDTWFSLTLSLQALSISPTKIKSTDKVQIHNLRGTVVHEQNKSLSCCIFTGMIKTPVIRAAANPT